MRGQTLSLNVDGKYIILVYNDDDMLEYVLDKNGNKMMIETVQEGVGYEIHENHGAFIKANVCDARYVRVMELDCFVPKYLYIKNK